MIQVSFTQVLITRGKKQKTKKRQRNRDSDNLTAKLHGRQETVFSIKERRKEITMVRLLLGGRCKCGKISVKVTCATKVNVR